MSNNDSDWANLSYDDYSEEEPTLVIKKEETSKEQKKELCKYHLVQLRLKSY